MKAKPKSVNGKTSPLWGPKKRGGARPGSGRPTKEDKSNWGQITCVLRKDTIEKLRAGAAPKEGVPGKHFGDFLQFHLDRYPLPTREEYLAIRENKPLYVEVQPFRAKRRKVPLIISAGARVRASRIRRPQPRLSKKEFTQAILAAE